MIFKDYYKILDLETSRVSNEQIKVAYRLAAKKYHPDVNVGDNLAEERIKDINEAYRILSTPSSKRKYDRVWNANHISNGKKAYSVRKDTGSILNMFLGKTITESKEETESKNPIKGENIETEIKISIREAFYGLDKKISLRTIEGKLKTFTVTVPKGIRNEEKIRLIGQGKPGKNGGKNGDLFIKIQIEKDSKFELVGYDLYTSLYLTPWEAALGTRVNLEAIDDTVSIYIPAGIESGEKLRIPGKGYKDGKGGRGDLTASVKIMVPKNLTKEEKELYERMKEISKFNPRNRE